jgi:positive phototaxis protein PixI
MPRAQKYLDEDYQNEDYQDKENRSEEHELLERGREGDLDAIATLITLQLSQPQLEQKISLQSNKSELIVKDLRVQVSKRNQYLGVLLEATNVPDCETASQIVGQCLAKLKLQGIQGLKIFGRKKNSSMPVWRRNLELVPKALEQDHLSLLDWMSQGTTMPTEAKPQNFGGMLSGLTPDKAIAEGRRYLRFYFSVAETALLPLDRIDEVFQAARSSILPMPNMPESVVGICNCRGGMLWLVDLGHQLGFPSSMSGSSEIVAVVVIREGEHRVGLAVPHIVDIETYLTQDLRPPSKDLFLPNLLQFMEGYLTRSSSPVLDVRAIACDPRLQVHSYSAV